MAKTQFLDFELHLNDPDRVKELQDNPPGETSLVRATGKRYMIRAPDTIAVDFKGEQLNPDGTNLPFVTTIGMAPFTGTPLTGKPAPAGQRSYIYSVNFDTGDGSNSKNYPTDRSTFTRKSGGWFGIPALFGTTTRFYWRCLVVYDAPLTTDGKPGGPITTSFSERLWVDPLFANGGATPADPVTPEREYEITRDASPNVDGFGLALRGVSVGGSAIRQHKPTDYSGGGASTDDLVWERLYVRWRRAGSTPVEFWRAYSTVGANVRVALALTPSGQISITGFNGAGTGTLMGTAGQLTLNKWIKLDIISRQGVADGPNAKGGTIWLYINGVQVVTVTFTSGVGFNTVGKHERSEIGTTVTGFDAEIDIGFWMGARVPFETADGVKLPVITGTDFKVGSRAVLVRASGDDASRANWTGEWRLLATLFPRTANTGPRLTSTTANARLAVTTDALRAINGLPGVQGVVAMCVTTHGYKGTNNGKLGYKFNGGADVLKILGAPDSINNEGADVNNRSWGSMMFQNAGEVGPTGAYRLIELTDFVLLRTKGNDAVESGTDHLGAVAEVIGTFHAEDFPALDAPPENPVPFLGVHNAPYPRSVWAQAAAPPSMPVFKHSGTYAGTGTFVELFFKAPVHWIWIEKVTNVADSPIQARWWSSMLGASLGGEKSPKPWVMPSMEIDPTFTATTTDNPPSGVGALPDRSSEVAAIVNANLEQLASEDTKIDLLQIIIRALNPTDNNNWGLLTKQDQGNKIPADIIVWKPTMDHVDVLTDAGPTWLPKGVVPNPAWVWTQVKAEGQQEQQYVLRITSADIEVNKVGETYAYMAYCDPAMRFCLNGAVSHVDAALPATDALIHPTFQAIAAFYLDQRPGTSATITMGYKGPGHAAADATMLNVAGTNVTPALTFAAGTIKLEAGLNGAGTDTHLVFNLWRRNDGSGDAGVVRVAQMGSYTGDGAAGDRIIDLTPPSERRPLWALVVPHGSEAYLKGFWHTGGNSSRMTGLHVTTAIKNSPGADKITIGATINAAGITYDYFVFPGAGGTPGPDGFDPPVPDGDPPVDPIPPTPVPGPQGDPPEPPVPPTEPPGTPPGGPGTPPGGPGTPPGGDPPGTPGGGPDDTNTDLALDCYLFTQRIFNDALARIGISKRILFTLVEDPPTVFTPTPPNTEEYDVCNANYARAIEQTLSDFPWPFSTRYATLELISGSTSAPVNRDWTYSYKRPIDCRFERRLAVLRQGAVDPPPPPFQLSYDNTLGIGRILTNQPTAQLEYTARPLCTAGRGDPLFLDALTWKLASRIAGPLTRIADVVSLCLTKYDDCIKRAHEVMRPGNPGPWTAVDVNSLDTATGALDANIAVVNRALVRIGARTIRGFGIDQSREAESARLVFEEELRATLHDFPWPFATTYALLGAAALPPSLAPLLADWAFAYSQPPNTVFERRIIGDRGEGVNTSSPPFQLLSTTTAGNVILTNQAAAVLEYTARVSNAVLRGDPLFREALTWRLAWTLAPSLGHPDPEGEEQLGRGPRDPALPRERPAAEQQLRALDAAACEKRYWQTIERAREILRPGNPGPVPATATIDLAVGAAAANVKVANIGLVRIGAQTIANLGTDQSREAQAVRLVFEDELRAVLRDHPWSFATRYIDAPVLVAGTATVAANDDWQFAYREPVDAVKVRRIVTESHRLSSERQPEMFRTGSDATGGLIFSNRENPTFEYTARIDNCVLRSDVLFRDALSWRIAASVAPSLATVDPSDVEQAGRGPGDPKRRERKSTEAQLRARAADAAWRQYYLVIEKARIADASEGQPDPNERDADWITGRD